MNSKYTLENGIKLRQASPDALREKQLVLLKEHLYQAASGNYYKNLFRELDFSPEDLKSLDDLDRLPLTDRKDLDMYAGQFKSTDLEIADLSLTSGTTGSPVIVPYSCSDLERLAFNEAIAFKGVGLSSEDRVLISVTMDRCFIAGLAYYSGLVQLGATAIRSGPGQPARQWELIHQLNPTAIVGVPTFLVEIAKWGKEHGLSPEKAGMNHLITIGEPIRKPDLSLTKLGQELTELWQAPIATSYGATELETGVCECHLGKGGHIHPELMIVEIINENGKSVKNGEPGEVVVTPLGVEGFPLVRFKTGDVARVYDSFCDCGWKTPRMGPIEGRLAQRLKFRGTTIYPETIFHTLQEMPKIKAAYMEVRASYDLSDEIKVVAGTDSADLDPEEITKFLQAKLRVRPEVEVLSAAEVVSVMEKAGGRKLKRFFDFR
jgi:phenylacetate-CoA ligase